MYFQPLVWCIKLHIEWREFLFVTLAGCDSKDLREALKHEQHWVIAIQLRILQMKGVCSVCELKLSNASFPSLCHEEHVCGCIRDLSLFIFSGKSSKIRLDLLWVWDFRFEGCLIKEIFAWILHKMESNNATVIQRSAKEYTVKY